MPEVYFQPLWQMSYLAPSQVRIFDINQHNYLPEKKPTGQFLGNHSRQNKIS